MDKKINNKIEKKQVIQYMVDRCMESKGTNVFGNRVQMLRDFICLEIPELKSNILEKEKQLKLSYREKIKRYIEENEYFHPVKRVMHEVEDVNEFYEEIFDEIEKNNN